MARQAGRTRRHRSRPRPESRRRHHRQDHDHRAVRLRPAPVRDPRPLPGQRRHPGPRADGHRPGSGARGHRRQAGRPGGDPLQHLLRHLLHVHPRSPLPVRDHPGPRPRHRGLALRLHQAVRQVPGGQAQYLRVPFGNTLPVSVPHGPPDDRYVYLSDVLPTAWQAVEYADIPPGGSVAVLGLGPIGDMSCRIATHQARTPSSASTSFPNAWTGPAAAASTPWTSARSETA